MIFLQVNANSSSAAPDSCFLAYPKIRYNRSGCNCLDCVGGYVTAPDLGLIGYTPTTNG